MEVEKVPSLRCEECDGVSITIVDGIPECDDCNAVTAQTSDFLKEKNKKLLLMSGDFNEIR